MEDPSPIIPVEMRGLSMAPWLMPRDVLLVDRSVCVSELRLGDIVVWKNPATGDRTAHRIVKRPLVTKGDRNPEVDPEGDGQMYEGRVIRRHRNGVWTPMRWRWLGWFLCRFNLYPEQRLAT